MQAGGQRQAALLSNPWAIFVMHVCMYCETPSLEYCKALIFSHNSHSCAISLLYSDREKGQNGADHTHRACLFQWQMSELFLFTAMINPCETGHAGNIGTTEV